MKKIIELILKILAKKLIKKFSPKVVGITGSVGKTTTRSCIAHVLKYKYKVLESIKNYNSEIGLPLSILELEAPTKKKDWIPLLKKAFQKAFFTEEYYEILVLEMGSDKPGDLTYLTSIVRPDVAIVTNVGHVHLENYNSRDELAFEKSTLIRKLKPKGVACLNYDDDYTRQMENVTHNDNIVIKFGFDKNADFYISNINQNKNGITANLHTYKNTFQIEAPALIGKHSLYAVLASWVVAKKFHIPIYQILAGLKTFKAPGSRLEIIPGENHMTLIDSSYNAEPSSVKAAIKTLKKMETKYRKIAILGDMMELGKEEENAHKDIGIFASQSRLDLVCFIGKRMKVAYEAFENESSKYHKGAVFYEDIQEATLKIQKKLKKGDYILIKGSRSMEMEKIVEEMREKTDEETI